MTKPKLFIALTSTHGLMQTMFIPTLMNLFERRSFNMVLWNYIDPYTPLARNAAAADFLKSDCTHMMFIDVDILDPQVSEHIQRLLDHDEPIVGGLYPKKDEKKLTWVCNALEGRPPEDERGLISLKHIGTGFMMVKREVFEKMIEVIGQEIAYLEYETDRPLWDFFDMPRVDGRKISEDWHFCNVSRQLGFKIYGDTRILLMHIGTAIFPLRHQAERKVIDVLKEETASAA
jgi:hypothetical protein